MANNQVLKLRIGGFNSGTIGFAVRTILADESAIDTQTRKTTESVFGKFVNPRMANEVYEELKRQNLQKAEIFFNKAAKELYKKKALQARQMMEDFIEPSHDKLCAGHKFVVVSGGCPLHGKMFHIHIEHQWRNV